MILCPVALLAGCKKCPVVSMCPLKTVIGNYPKEEQEQTESQAENDQE